MASSQIEISKIEIDPNRLSEFTKLPLPDFAVRALEKNEFTYKYKSHLSTANLSDSSDKKCGKLTDHIRFTKCHIDRDGARVWGSISKRDDNAQHTAQSTL